MLNISTVTCQLENEEILYVRWEYYGPFMKFNFEMYFFGLIEKVNRLKIKKMILDCSRRKHDPSEKDFKEIFELLLSGLSSTGLEKMARICPPATPSNAKFNQYLHEITTYLDLKFQLGNFNSTELALNWLREKNYELQNKQQK